MKRVILTAEHHNWSCHTIYEWHQTKYVLFEDGTLLSIIFEDGDIVTREKHLRRDELNFISDNIRSFINDAPEVDACDGSAWKFEGRDFSFDLGYIYGTELEKIADILE